jgi:hypothetical protein
MSTFKDNAGREWTVALDGPTIREVRKACGVDLAAVDGSASEKLRDDPVLLVDSLWVICRAQALAARVTDAEFGKALVGDAIEFATEALIEAINDFFPSRRREALKTLTARMKETREAGMEDALELLTNPETQSKVRTAMKQNAQKEIDNLLTRLSSATESPVPLASVPTATPFGSSGK